MSEYPSFKLKGIQTLRDHLVREVLVPQQGQHLTIELLQHVASQLVTELPTGIKYDTIFESIRYLLDGMLTGERSLLLAWRLAGNTKQLQGHQPITPWVAQRAAEWAPLQILRAAPHYNRDRKRQAIFTLRVMAGTAAGMKITSPRSLKFAKLLASRVGFSSHWNKYPYNHYTELVGLRFLGLLDPVKSREQPVFSNVHCPDGLMAWNRANVLRYRVRGEQAAGGTHCPRRFPHPCHRCAVGFTECPGGTHRMTYVVRCCDLCGKIDAIFDPEVGLIYCIECTKKAQRDAARI